MGSKLSLVTAAFKPSENQSWLGSAHGTDNADSITLDGDSFLATFTDGVIPSGVVLAKVTASGKYKQYAGGTAANEQQSIIATGGTTGDFTLGFGGETTAAIAYNATAAQVQAALMALANIEPGDLVCAGGPLPATAVTVTFGGQYVDQDVPALVVTDNITGGTATVTTPTAGAGATATDGTEIARGHLLTTVDLHGITSGVVEDVTAALFWHGEVVEAKLPANHGLTAAAKAALAQIRYV